MSVTFATKTWKGDIAQMLMGGFTKKWQAIDYPFDSVNMVVNNGLPFEAFPGADETIFAERILDAFGIDARNVYADGELAAVLTCHSEYLCFVQGDVITTGGDWVTPGIEILEREPDTWVVSPASDVNTWHDITGHDEYMSDQAFLIRTADFIDRAVYEVEGTDYDYPSYGGESFEHMVGKYLKLHHKKRCILTEFYALHPAY